MSLRVVFQVNELGPDQDHALLWNKQIPAHLTEKHGLQSVHFLEVEASHFSIEVVPREFVVIHFGRDNNSSESHSINKSRSEFVWNSQYVLTNDFI